LPESSGHERGLNGDGLNSAVLPLLEKPIVERRRLLNPGFAYCSVAPADRLVHGWALNPSTSCSPIERPCRHWDRLDAVLLAGVAHTAPSPELPELANRFIRAANQMFAASHPELTRSVILLAAGGKVQPKPDAEHALQVIFNPKSTEADVLAVMNYLVANPADSARVWAIFKRSLDPRAAAFERAAAESTPWNLGGRRLVRPSI
jgi:hypothetical protein